MSNMSYMMRTYIYAYDEDTKIRVLIEPDGTKLAVATDIARALGYQSNSSAGAFIRDLHLVSYIKQISFDTRKRGVAKAHCLPVESVKQMLDRKCNNPDFCDWLINTVMVKNKGRDDENEPIRPYKNVESNAMEQAAKCLKESQNSATAQIDKIIAELLILRQQLS